jgi:hypothetical protein
LLKIKLFYYGKNTVPDAINNEAYNEDEIFKNETLYSTSKVLKPTLSIFSS